MPERFSGPAPAAGPLKLARNNRSRTRFLLEITMTATNYTENERYSTGRPDSRLSMVERMTMILDAFDQRHWLQLNLQEITHKTQLPRSTTHRILDQLVRMRWLDRAEHGYSLGPRALGGQDRIDGEIRAAAGDALLKLHLQTGAMVLLTTLDGVEEVFLDRVGGRSTPAHPTAARFRWPAHRTSSGRAMLACLTPEHVDGLLEGTGAEWAAGWNIAVLHRELARIRRGHGSSIERLRRGPGLDSVAFAIRSQRCRPIAAVSLWEQAGLTSIDRFVPRVAETAYQISKVIADREARTSYN
ncbi:IclR family transcriptional regulator [Prescottella equi]|uniref:IclR family transcriptional regulator n=1 Tax=Rhodococcus hoagii TaxID=43767 RepID=UPI001C794D55|nr:helix-turn-helix domain-containing protein [Prescottella equi]BCN76661.1 hypothetical protein RE0346_03210 [Prescottella equi]